MSLNLSRKLLFSNLSYKTTEQILINYFSIYGFIEELYLYKDDQDQSLRKGFIIYKDIYSVNNFMLKRPHFIDQRQIHIQRSIPNQCRNNNNNISEQLGINLTVNEIFISRLCSGEKREIFINYFQSYGNIIDCRVFNSYSQNSKQTGYAFVRFTDYDSVGKKIKFQKKKLSIFF
jgi:RNA recognition motif-containing protein